MKNQKRFVKKSKTTVDVPDFLSKSNEESEDKTLKTETVYSIEENHKLNLDKVKTRLSMRDSKSREFYTPRYSSDTKRP